MQQEVEQEEVQENLLRGRLLSRYALLIFEHPELPRACSRVTASRVSVRGADGGWHVLHACGWVFCHVLSYTVPIPANKVNRILLWRSNGLWRSLWRGWAVATAKG